jgi:glutamate/tyrosine decarboxylase-like PLP-dependent enzyme
MGVELLTIPPDQHGRLTGDVLMASLASFPNSDLASRLCAVVATAGTAELGIVDDLDSIALACDELKTWLHVDGSYGLAALLAPSRKHIFSGVERADSLVVDPHKWLFSPYDCSALIYRDPTASLVIHRQEAGYLEALHAPGAFNPSDYAFGGSRRARGLPLWFSLAAFGVQAYSDAIEQTLSLAKYAAAAIGERSTLELIREPDLSVVAFRRIGWGPGEYASWSARLVSTGSAFMIPAVHNGRPFVRMAFTNPRTTTRDIDWILDSLA